MLFTFLDQRVPSAALYITILLISFMLDLVALTRWRTADRDQGSAVHAGLPHRGADLRFDVDQDPCPWKSSRRGGMETVAVLGYACRLVSWGAACGCGVVLGFLGVGEF